MCESVKKSMILRPDFLLFLVKFFLRYAKFSKTIGHDHLIS